MLRVYLYIYFCSHLSFISVVYVIDEYIFLLLLFSIGTTPISAHH